MIHGAKVASYFRRGAEFGVAAGDWKIEMPAVRDRKRTMVDGIVARNVDAYRESGAELVKGQGRFVGPRTIEVTADDGTRTLRGEVIVICTGSRRRIDPIPGLAESRPMTHIEALELDRVPKHLLVLGGGYVGLEMAQALRRFGSRVTVIERNDALVHREDRDVSEALRELFDDEGIEVLTVTPVTRVEGRSGESVRLHATQGVIEGSDLLVASGRTPNTDGIGLETAGIERDDRGFIKVDERLRTSAAGVWAVGNCAGSPHFTHIADDDVRVIRDNLAGIDRVTTGRLVFHGRNSRNSRGWAWESKREHDKAIADFDLALAYRPLFVRALTNRGIAWTAKKDIRIALKDYERALEIDPQRARTHTYRGIAHDSLGLFDQAIADFNVALKQDPDATWPRYNRLVAYLGAGRPEATAEARRLLQLLGWSNELAVYTALLGHYAALRNGQLADLQEFLKEAAAQGNTKQWTYQVVRFLRGEIQEPELLGSATEPIRQTEAHSFLGLHSSLTG